MQSPALPIYQQDVPNVARPGRFAAFRADILQVRLDVGAYVLDLMTNAYAKATRFGGHISSSIGNAYGKAIGCFCSGIWKIATAITAFAVSLAFLLMDGVDETADVWMIGVIICCYVLYILIHFFCELRHSGRRILRLLVHLVTMALAVTTTVQKEDIDNHSIPLRLCFCFATVECIMHLLGWDHESHGTLQRLSRDTLRLD